jgi:glycosyltransferase involved in cell wall biosynthesis
MKIWFVEATEPLPGIDDNARPLRFSLLAQELVKQGHSIVWWTSTFNHANKRNRFNHACSIDLNPHVHLELMHGSKYSKNISVRRIRHHRLLAKSFKNLASEAQEKPDLIVTCVPILELAEQAVAYAKEHRIPVIVDSRDLWPDIYFSLLPKSLQPIAKRFLQSELRRAERIFKGASGITAVSDSYLNWSLAYAQRTRKNTDRVIPLGYPTRDKSRKTEIDRKAIELQTKYQLSGKLVVLFLGIFGRSYDLETVIRAARIIDQKKLPIQFILGGAGDLLPKLEEMSVGLSNVVFTGWLDPESMLALMQLSSVGLAAYHQKALQSLPNKLFEYMSSGLPILSSLKGEQAQLIAQEGIGISYEAGDEASLVQNLQWLLDNEEQRIAMGKKSQILFNEKFSQEKIYSNFVDYLVKMCHPTV